MAKRTAGWRWVGSTVSLRLLGVCVLSALGACASAPDYRQPALKEPHAVAKLRLAYHAWAGPMLEQTVMVDGSLLKDLPAPVEGGKGVVNQAVVLRPGTVRWTIRAAFFHNNVSSHAETFSSQQDHPCSDIACTESTPRTRLVNKIDRVDDAVCEIGMKQLAVAGESYVVEFDFQADRSCSLKCLRRVARPDGTSTTAPCEGG